MNVRHTNKSQPFLETRRNLFSALWTFVSLNYLYADLVGLMDKNMLYQYQIGIVNEIKITPDFLFLASCFMQIPLANIFLPQIIKSDSTLRWVQISCGFIMTFTQFSTLFIGTPTSYYCLFSVIEIGTTVYISLKAYNWK